ncbi:hypothetical protein CPB83DRAFT_69806 [Crepidotus variabilis]|uniref:Uncharacterized protein n=1 Tax=Crepidotus variabilis TaxID=179855 RepID=A0A9P6E5H5_9AGAR|nr:hypothetical protein CPB83DRAFT_69806 [Crepidotus variabilis]
MHAARYMTPLSRICVEDLSADVSLDSVDSSSRAEKSDHVPQLLFNLFLHSNHLNLPIHSFSCTDLPFFFGSRFFKNTGAVAGVFTVVGLIALALVFAFITNIVRRRRAKAFDRELQEATREAAAAPAPAFLDDDDDGYGPHGVGSTGAYSSGYVASSNERQFSDLSHGTYGQNPMGHAETYNMRELGPGAGVGEIYDPYAGAAAGAAGGAAGIGIARARSMKSDNSAGNSYGAALADGASPYAAFAGPQGGYNNAPPMPGAGMGGGDPFGATAAQKNLELLEAAGMGAHIAGAGAGTVGALSRSQSQYRDQQPGYGYPQQQQHPQTAQRLSTQSPNDYLALERNRSLGSSGHSHEPSPNSASTGATQYYSPGVVSPYANTIQAHAQQSYQSQIQQPPQQRWSVVNEDPEDAYGGYSPPPGVPAPGALPNPFAGATSTDSHTKEWDRESRASSYSQEEPKRVLKVANE